MYLPRVIFLVWKNLAQLNTLSVRSGAFSLLLFWKNKEGQGNRIASSVHYQSGWKWRNSPSVFTIFIQFILDLTEQLNPSIFILVLRWAPVMSSLYLLNLDVNKGREQILLRGMKRWNVSVHDKMRRKIKGFTPLNSLIVQRVRKGMTMLERKKVKMMTPSNGPQLLNSSTQSTSTGS